MGKSFNNNSLRLSRVNELIKRKLSNILFKLEIHNSDQKNVSVTISTVNCSADLKLARIYVLPLGGMEANHAIKALNLSKNEIRHQLGKNLELKYVPQLYFLADKTLDYLEETERLLSDPVVKNDINS